MAVTLQQAIGDNALADVHNVFETQVMQEVQRLWARQPDTTADYWADVACVALNQLPARYIRYDVDLASHLSDQEQQELEKRVRTVVHQAREVVGSRRQGQRD